jgi:two-component system, chemotaxis family, sensor kinase Cph1
MTSLNSLVENVLHDLESETPDRKIDWRVGSLPSVNCDPGLIQQVFANLLSNAVKYTRHRERAVIEIDQSINNGQPVFFVRDNGAGFIRNMSRGFLEHFSGFTPTKSLKAPAWGLPRCSASSENTGDASGPMPRPTRGATFYFSLDEAAAISGAVNRHASGK